MAGLTLVLVLHGALLYGLLQYRIPPPPAESVPLFVNLLHDPPKPKHTKPPVAKPRPVKLDQPLPPDPPPLQELAEQVPAISSAEPVAPPPPGAPAGIATPSEPARPLEPAGPVILGGDLAFSCPERAAPAYPLISRRLGEEGKTVLRVELDESGLIERTAVKTSSGYARLDDAALTAVKHWHCKPVKRDGILVRAVALQPFRFVLEGR